MLTDFDCELCGDPLEADHTLWHTDEATGGDCHERCCTTCHPPVHPGQLTLEDGA